MQKRDFEKIFREFNSATLGSTAHYFDQQAEQPLAKHVSEGALASAATGMLVDASSPKDHLRVLVGKDGRYPETVGGHPDFDYLEHGQTEYHYIVSVFADIKGSTKLATKLPLEDVRKIKNGSLATMIDIFQSFDGHIHRLQGDGVLAFFGRRGVTPSQAIVDALNASSFLQYYFANVLRPKFEDKGFPPISIRIGVDYGDDEKVLWSRYGVANCDEITTTSMHTDLAAKLQGRARSNGIMIGDNVRSHLDFPEEFYSRKSVVRDGEQKTDNYVLQYQGTNYGMWELDWEKYLARFLFNPGRKEVGSFKAGHDFQYSCSYKEGESWSEYPPNCKTLPKSKDLIFTVSDFLFRWDSIEWRVVNRGMEASNADQLNFVMEKFKNKKACTQVTAYTGHHYMVCTIRYQGRVVAKEHIGVYVNDN